MTLVEMGKSKQAEMQGPVGDSCPGRLKGKLKLQRRPRAWGHRLRAESGGRGVVCPWEVARRGYMERRKYFSNPSRGYLLTTLKDTELV